MPQNPPHQLSGATPVEGGLPAQERIARSSTGPRLRIRSRVLDWLGKIFAESRKVSRKSSHHAETDDDAEEFTRAVAALDEAERTGVSDHREDDSDQSLARRKRQCRPRDAAALDTAGNDGMRARSGRSALEMKPKNPRSPVRR